MSILSRSWVWNVSVGDVTVMTVSAAADIPPIIQALLWNFG